MITGAHVLLYSKDPAADRSFFRNVLQFRSVDAGEGWLIFELPPSELAVHPGEGEFAQKHADHNMIGALVYFMCDDLHETVKSLKAKSVECTEISEEEWGIKTPSGCPAAARSGCISRDMRRQLGLGKADGFSLVSKTHICQTRQDIGHQRNFRLVEKEEYRDPSTRVSRAGKSAREPSLARDDIESRAITAYLNP